MPARAATKSTTASRPSSRRLRGPSSTSAPSGAWSVASPPSWLRLAEGAGSGGVAGSDATFLVDRSPRRASAGQRGGGVPGDGARHSPSPPQNFLFIWMAWDSLAGHSGTGSREPLDVLRDLGRRSLGVPERRPRDRARGRSRTPGRTGTCGTCPRPGSCASRRSRWMSSALEEPAGRPRAGRLCTPDSTIIASHSRQPRLALPRGYAWQHLAGQVRHAPPGSGAPTGSRRGRPRGRRTGRRPTARVRPSRSRRMSR